MTTYRVVYQTLPTAVDLAEYVPAGESYVTFDQARDDCETLINARNVSFD